MTSLIHLIAKQWDLWIGQYRAFFPTSEEDLAACEVLLKRQPKTSIEVSEDILLAACQDTQSGALVACLKIVDGDQVRKLNDYNHLFPFELLPADYLPRTVVFFDLVIEDGNEKTSASLVLMSHCFVEVLKVGGVAAMMSCDPERFYIFKRLGLRPIGAIQKLPDDLGERIAMICLPDLDYLSVINSPVLPLLRNINFRVYEDICQWYYQLLREHSHLRTGSAFYPEMDGDFEGHHSITEGLSEEGKRAFLKDTFVLNCHEGDVLITENDGGKAFGFVNKGLVKVVIGGKTLVVLGEGDIFGEIAFVLHSKRTAQVIAASSETEVVLFNESSLNRLKSDADKAIIWHNLARILAQRVVVTNKLLG